MANDLIVRILGDTKGLERSFAQANRSTVQFGRNVETTGAKVDKTARSFKSFAAGAGAGFGGAFVASEVISGMRTAIDVASNLNEQISKTNVVFGDSADVIKDWAKTTAGSIGIANDQALEAASTFGSMFDAADQSSANAARLSKQVVQLAADLASFNNTSVDDSLTALRSGLSGEIEPLRRFQVFLTEASVAAEAMAQSGKKSAKELTQGEKIMARWSLILQQTNKQQGDFARTSEGLANQQRTLAAQTRDLQAAVGSALLPVMESFVGVLVTATDEALKLADALKVLARIKIPTITIPFTTQEVGGGTLGGTAGKVAGVGLLGAISPAALFAVAVKEAVDRIRGEQPDAGDINALATAFDEKFSTFTNQAVEAVNKAVKNTRGGGGKPSFGQAGFKTEENTLAEDNARRFEDALAALSLKFDQKVLSRGTADELAVLAEMRKVIQARIAVHGKTTELMRLLFNVDQQQRAVVEGAAAEAKRAREATAAAIEKAAADRKEKAAKAAAALKEAIQASQFRALGLSEAGDEIIPGVKNLAKRIDGTLRRIASGQADLPTKLVERLKLARKLIKQEGAKLTAETRSTINDILNAVTKAEDKITKGPLTKTTSLNAAKILDGLGLPRDMEKELRARLSSFNSAGKALAGAQTRTTGGFRGTGTVVVENHNTINLDGDVVAKNTTKSQQRTGRVNPRQKRGPNSGI